MELVCISGLASVLCVREPPDESFAREVVARQQTALKVRIMSKSEV